MIHEEKAPFYVRWASRIVANYMSKDKQNITYQVHGEKNWDYDNSKSANIQVPESQIIHWMLRSCGHELCEADVLKMYYNIDLRKKL